MLLSCFLRSIEREPHSRRHTKVIAKCRHGIFDLFCNVHGVNWMTDESQVGGAQMQRYRKDNFL